MPRPWLTNPALFITATDTGVGKTAVTCGIARLLAERGTRVGVCKPVATGGTKRRGRWISDDALALRRHANVPLDLADVQPIGYELPLAPAAAVARGGRPVSMRRIDAAIRRIANRCDVLLIEGIGGMMVPISPRRTVLDLAARIDAPLVVVTRAGLGTLNHTALTCGAIAGAGLRLAGLVVNATRPDPADTSRRDNPHWLSTQNRTPILATTPYAPRLAPHRRALPEAFVDALRKTDWLRVAQPPR